jgi:serine/threonine-protein kinase RsbW/sigma-B regulation protein RsbU (phosphoserine phosphatase)
MPSLNAENADKVLLLDYTMPSQVVMFGNLAVSVEDAIPDLPDIAFSANLCLEELITNTIQYGLANAPDHAIRICISRSTHCLEIVLKDDAPPFDPFNTVAPPDIEAGVDERAIGGLGVHLVRSLMDEAWATYDGTGNLITLKKTLKQ